VVSIWRTASFSNSSVVVKGLGVYAINVSEFRSSGTASMTRTNFLQAFLCGSGMLASTLLISLGPKPVAVLLCLGLVKLAGPTGPCRSASGELMEGRRSRAGAGVIAILRMAMGGKEKLLKARWWWMGDTGFEEVIVGAGLELVVWKYCSSKVAALRRVLEGQVFSLFQRGRP
jgi:hypothetical protein